MVYVRLWLFIVTVLTIGYLGYRDAGALSSNPCAPTALPARCYNVTQPVCETVWTHAETTCKEWVKKFKLSPGRLIGPIIHQCQLLELDSFFPYSSKPTEECEKMRSDLKDWQRRNI